MKFIYASLLCAVASAFPITEIKREMSGAAVDGFNKALKTTFDSIKNIGIPGGLGGLSSLGGLGGGLGAAKRDEQPEARQTEHVAVRLDQPSVDVSLGDGKQVDKRQEGPSKLTALLQTASHAVLGPHGLGGGVGLKRDGKQEPSKRQLNIPSNLLADVTSGKLMEDLHNLHITG